MLNYQTKFNREFCVLLNIDPKKDYTMSYIYDKLISHSSFSYGKYIFEDKNITNFINNISGIFYVHFTKKNLMDVIKKLKTESLQKLKNNYIIIYNEISDVNIYELNIIL